MKNNIMKTNKRKNKSKTKQTDLSLKIEDIPYTSSKWFDIFYSDVNWSPNDIKLGLEK